MNSFPQTIKLYDADAYQTSFSTDLLSLSEAGTVDSVPQYYAVFAATLFFPEEGGQSPDRGTVTLTSDGISCKFLVSDVQIKGGIITHTLIPDSEPDVQTAPEMFRLFGGGTSFHVSGAIDWEHRFSNMQQHSGEHIFSGIVHRMFGYDNVGFHLSDQTVTMDYNGPLTEEEVRMLELETNRAITANVPIIARYPSAEELADLDYRSKKEINGAIRIVTVEGYDVCACCAPHVARTGEIGFLKVLRVQSYKGGVRLTILCGFRALHCFTEKQTVLSALCTQLSTGEEQLSDSIAKMKATIGSLKYELSGAQRSYLSLLVTTLPKEQQNVLLFESSLEQSVARELLNSLVQSHPGYCGFFLGDDTKGYQFLIASSQKNCAELAARMRTALNAKGGGPATMIQGSTSSDRAAIEAYFEALID